jgi:hypothetical protein
MRIKLIIFEIVLTISAPAFLIAARHLVPEFENSPAAVSIKAGGTVQGTARTKGRITGPLRSPEIVSRAFRISPGLEEQSTSADLPGGEEKPIPIVHSQKSLGLIRDGDNIERLYIKDMHTDTITSVRIDGNPEGGNYLVSALEDMYVIDLDGMLYSLRRE